MKKSLSMIALAIAGSFSGAASAAIDLTGLGYFTYGNTNSYSLPVLAVQYDAINGGGAGPGNPFYIPSGPGQIQDQIVIYTGASGTGVTTNVAGFDDAYGAPNGQVGYASIDGSVGMTDPGDKAGITNNNTETWDANLVALKGFLNGGNALFMFNNNDTNQDQNLAIWAKIWLTDANDALYGRYLYLSNHGAGYGQGGSPLGDATTYNPGDVLPVAGNLASTDYVLSGGSVCIELDGDVTFGACTGANDAGSKTINHNLGANQVAYMADVPLLNGYLNTLFAQSDATLGGYTLHMDLKLGCSQAWGNNCSNIKIDNGYEQLFLTSTAASLVPEPGMLGLVGLGLLGAAATRRRAGRAADKA